MRGCDVEKWAVQQLPMVLRRSRMMALVAVLCGPVGRLVTQGSRWVADVMYEVRHVSQVCKMRALLNDRLDADERRVEIVDADRSADDVMLFARERSKPVLLGAVLLPPRGYDAERELNFVVRAPRQWRGTSKADRLVALVNRSKLASMRYRVEYV